MTSNTNRSSWNSGSFSWRGTRIVPKVYNKSERLGLEFWDPRRLASHVLATLLPVDQRAELAKFILEMKITGSFLQRYTHQIEELLLSEGDGELVRAIARTISETFWIPQREPRAHDRYSLREIAEDLRASQADSDFAPSVAGQEPASWMRVAVCAASGAQVQCAEPEAVEGEDERFPLLEPVDSRDGTISACACNEAKIEGDHDEIDERGRNGQGGGMDNDGDGGGIIPGALLSYWTRSSLAVGTGPRSMFWDWHSTFSRGLHGDNDETVSETGHMTVSGRTAVSSSIHGGTVTDATVFPGCMMGFVDMSYL